MIDLVVSQTSVDMITSIFRVAGISFASIGFGVLGGMLTNQEDAVVKLVGYAAYVLAAGLAVALLKEVGIITISII